MCCRVPLPVKVSRGGQVTDRLLAGQGRAESRSENGRDSDSYFGFLVDAFAAVVTRGL